MQINITGNLTDPMGQFLIGKSIRVTDLLTGTVGIYLTGSEGLYNFTLKEGRHYVELLDTDTYILAGEVTVDQGTPTNISIEELLMYSVKVEITPAIPSPVKEWFDRLRTATLTRIRSWREQMRDEHTTVVEYKETLVNKELEARDAFRYSETTSCGAKVQRTDNSYSNALTQSASSNESLISGSDKASYTRQLGDGYDEVNLITVKDSGIQEHRHLNSNGYTEGKTTPLETLTASVRAGVKTLHKAIGKLTFTANVSDTLTESVETVGSITTKQSDGSKGKLIKTTVDKYSDTTEVKDKSKRTIIVDEFNIGNNLVVADNKVTVNGMLVINGLEDPDGNPILPEDGKTIFQVSQYAETPTSPWHDTIQPHDNWKRDNLSVNGVIDDTKWSIAYRFKGVDGTPGQTIVTEYEYSPDGATDWSDHLKTGDKFRRERIVTNGVAGPWSEPARIAGSDGTTIEIRSQYSVDGVYHWHDTLAPADKFERRARFEDGKQTSPWSDPFAIGKGAPGIPGAPGVGWYSIVGNGGEWAGDTQATADFTREFGRAPRKNDHLMYLDKYPEPHKSNGKRCNSELGDPVTWSTPAMAVNGDMLVDGCISARNIVAHSITGNEINAQSTIIAGAGSWTAGMNGNDAHPTEQKDYNGWRFWAGAPYPNDAPFRVDKTGKFWSFGGEFHGHLEAETGHFGGELSGNLITGATIQGSSIKGSVITGSEIYTGTSYFLCMGDDKTTRNYPGTEIPVSCKEIVQGTLTLSCAHNGQIPDTLPSYWAAGDISGSGDYTKERARYQTIPDDALKFEIRREYSYGSGFLGAVIQYVGKDNNVIASARILTAGAVNTAGTKVTVAGIVWEITYIDSPGHFVEKVDIASRKGKFGKWSSGNDVGRFRIRLESTHDGGATVKYIWKFTNSVDPR